MEVKGETSENVALFWKLFNDVLAEVKRRTWLPVQLMWLDN